MFAFEGRVDPADNSKPFNLEIATNTGITADLVRIEGALTPEEAQFRFQVLGATATLSPVNWLTTSSRRSCRRTGCAWTRRRRRLRSERSPQVLRGTIVLRHRRQPKHDCAAAGAAAMPPPPPETGPGFGLRSQFGKSLRPADDSQPAVRFGQRGSQQQEQVPDPGGELDQREDRTCDGARRSRRTQFGVRIPDRDKKGETGNLKFANILASAPCCERRVARDRRKGVVTGGGFLFHDRRRALCRRDAAVDHERITLKAFG